MKNSKLLTSSDIQVVCILKLNIIYLEVNQVSLVLRVVVQLIYSLAKSRNGCVYYIQLFLKVFMKCVRFNMLSIFFLVYGTLQQSVGRCRKIFLPKRLVSLLYH